MRKGVILNFKKLRILNYVNLNKIYILLCVLFIGGIAIGSIIYSKNESIAKFSQNFFEDYLSLHNNKTWISTLVISFLKYLLVLLLYFLSGTSMLGIAVVPFLTLWQGIFYGSVSSYLYAAYTLKGIAFNAIILVPQSIIFIICSFFAARASIDYSLIMVRLTLPKSKPANIYNDFRKYCGKFIVFCGISILTAVIDLILNIFFLHYFNF